MPSTFRHLPALAAITLAVVFGYLFGRLTTKAFTIPEIPTVLREDTRSIVPVVEIEGVREGKLRGMVKGEVRLFIGDDYVIPDGSGAFAIWPGSLLTNEVAVRVPAGMQFVASRRGSRYYPVASSAGGQIVPENRIYFRTATEAEAAGYARGK